MRNLWSLNGSSELARCLVYGLGSSGKAATRLLVGLGVAVVGVDGRPAEALDLDGYLARELGARAATAEIDVLAGGEPESLPLGIDAVVVSPGVRLDRPALVGARRRGVPILAEVELAFPFLDGPVAAVTGSNGKSTTTALAGAMLAAAGWEVAVCGNIGPPLAAQIDLDRLDPERLDAARWAAAEAAEDAVPAPPPRPPGKAYAVELSSFQLESIHRFRPRAAAFLNLAPDHIDRHGDLAAYGAAKRRIFENQTAADVAITNADDPATGGVSAPSRQRAFSRRGAVADGAHLASGGGDGTSAERVVEIDPAAAPSPAPTGPTESTEPSELFALADSPLAGAHNVENAMAAALLARALGASADDCRQGLAGFRGLPHRMERVTEAGGVAWYDDSKGTNPAATLGGLEGFPDGRVHLILGGRNKGSDLGALAAAVGKKARRLYLIGEAAGEMEAALGGVAPFSRSGTLERAIAEAAERARPGEMVVLSPACASFDQFRDFNHRGEEFHRLVRATVGGADGQEAGV